MEPGPGADNKAWRVGSDMECVFGFDPIRIVFEKQRQVRGFRFGDQVIAATAWAEAADGPLGEPVAIRCGEMESELDECSGGEHGKDDDQARCGKFQQLETD